jgi:hypothetical protein
MATSDHLDESGQPCTRHAPASPQGMLALALLGSRLPSFHHDVASKMQSLMMAVEEIADLAETSELQAAAATASTAVRDMQAMFMANRALQRPPVRRPTPLGELIASAAMRGGVKTRGELPAHDVDIALPTITHAVAIVFDLVAGPIKLGRTIELTATVVGEHVVVTATGPASALEAPPANATDVLALANFALVREHGELRCAPNGFAIWLPLQQ